jgi:hypothetical protein
VLATRDTSALLSRKISYPIFVNDKDPWNIEFIIRSIARLWEKNFKSS